VIIGGAFGKIVTSVVSDIIMPPIGCLVGGVNFSDLKVVLKDAVVEGEEIVSPAVTLNYGNFIQVVIDFLIIAFAVFMLIKGINALSRKKKEEPAAPAAPPEPSAEEKLLSEIRDLLKEKK
jgi:large conductance mechanosensitive channel